MCSNLKYLLLLVMMPFSVGCAGAKGNMTFDDLKYPASMSAFIYGNNNETLVKGDNLDVVGDFKYEKKFWGILYSMVPLSSDKDIVEAINRKIDEAGGEGLINLSVTAENCAFNSFPLLSLLPIMPGCLNVTIEGEIVKAKQKKTSLNNTRKPSNGVSDYLLFSFVPKDMVGDALSKLDVNMSKKEGYARDI